MPSFWETHQQDELRYPRERSPMQYKGEPLFTVHTTVSKWPEIWAIDPAGDLAERWIKARRDNEVLIIQRYIGGRIEEIPIEATQVKMIEPQAP